MDTYERVSFVSVEDGDDLIVSFFVISPDNPSDGRSIILLRDAKWEYVVPDQDKGVTVSDENFPDAEESQTNFLEQIRVSDSAVELKSTRFQRQLDVRRVERSDLDAMRELLKKMNFDKRFDLEFV